MCLGIPGQVVRMLPGYGDQLAPRRRRGRASQGQYRHAARRDLLPGDWVIIHMGFAVEKTDHAGAEAAMRGLELLGRGRTTEVPP